jgi:hypothetical protein
MERRAGINRPSAYKKRRRRRRRRIGVFVNRYEHKKQILKNM